MPVHTVYAKIQRKGKHLAHKTRNTPIMQFHRDLTDYTHLKEIIQQTARELHWKHDLTTAEITICKHLAGAYIAATTSYRKTRLHYKRIPLIQAKITYNPNADTMNLQKCTFLDFSVLSFKAAYRQEKGRKWTLPPATPEGFTKALHDGTITQHNFPPYKTSNYTAQPKGLYAPRQTTHHQLGMYTALPKGVYAARNWQTIIQDKAEKQNKL